MKLLIAAASAAALVAFAAPAAFAQTAPFAPVGLYGNLGYSYADANGGQYHVIDGRLGARLGRYLGAEGELGFGLNTDRSGGFDTKLKNAYAGYGVAFLPIMPNADLFARVGYGHTNAKATFGGVDFDTGEDSVNFGGGGQYFFTPHDGLRAEYTRFDYRHNGGAANVWSASYVRKF